MSDGIDLQDILRAGFFLTSRARHSFSPSSASSTPFPDSPIGSSASSHIPRSFEKLARRRRSYPPSPFVEDEIDSVRKEFESFVIPVVDEEPRSRGDIEQQPILVQVFEYNPERRYIHVAGLYNKFTSGAEIRAARKIAYKKAKSAKSSPSDLKNESKPETDGAKPQKSAESKPSLGRRKSRQDLPRIETDLEDHETPTSHHHRSKSCAGDARPNFTPNRHHHHHHHHVLNDEFLSPRVSRHSPNGRAKTHHRYDSADHYRSATPSGYGDKGERTWDGKRWRSLTPSIDGRSSPRFGTNSSPVSSSDRPYESRHRDRDSKRSPRSPRSDRRDRRDSFGSPSRSRESDLGKASSRHKHRQSSWSSVDAFLRKSRHRLYPVFTDDGRSSLGVPSDDIRVSRSPSRVRTMPITSSHVEGFSTPEKPYSYQSSSSFPINHSEETQDPKKVQLPYPDDDESQAAWFEEVSSSGIPRQLQPGASMTSMPHIPPVMEEATSSVDPEHASIGDPSEASLRFSDSRGENDGQVLGLPACSRTVPTAGLVDWITLPRTNFNICPDCYGHVFSFTQFRAHFQPILRPTVDPIVCDFGSSPWYRIAWLLTLKNQESDLRLFYKVANALASTSSRPCPGPQKALEYWYIVKDPFTRRAVPDFTVCYECVKMVEALFPSLGDIFCPHDAWQEPTLSICALHFAPDRKQFVLYFDAIETAAELAYKHDRLPDVGDLCMTLSRIGTFNECRESRRVHDGYWHSLDFLPELTVCGECYEDVVRPQQSDDNDIARNFHSKPHKLPVATCQLYSPRMRDIFKWACRRNDSEYLEERLRERRQIEEDLHARFVHLTKDGRRNRWTEEQIDKLAREWRKWE